MNEYNGQWCRIGRELVLIQNGTTVKREPTTLGPVAARKECERRNKEHRKEAP